MKGHRLVGGLRVSFYNAVSLESTRVLRDFMRQVARNAGASVIPGLPQRGLEGGVEESCAECHFRAGLHGGSPKAA